MDRIDELEFFRTVAASASLTAAGRDLGMSLPAVSKRLSQLEARLGVRLARRTTRRFDLTAEGQLFAHRAARILSAIDDLEDLVVNQRGGLKGQLDVHSTLGFGRRHLAPLISAFSKDHPELEIRLDLSPTPLSIAETRFDVGIRIGAPPDSRLIARRLAPNRRVVCATPAYLERMGTPTHPEDLTNHNCIVLRENEDDYAIWRFRNGESEQNIRVTGLLSSNDGEAVTAWGLDGHGLIMRSLWHVQGYLDAGTLVRVLPEVETPGADIFAAYEASSHVPHRVSSFVDFLRTEVPRRLAST